MAAGLRNECVCGHPRATLLHCRANRGLLIYGWVIINTHFHAVLAGPELAKTVMAIKRHTSLLLLEQVKAEGREWLMNQLAYYKSPHKTASQHQVWQEVVHPQVIVDDDNGAKANLHSQQPGEARVGNFAGALAVFFGTWVARWDGGAV